MAPGMVPAPMLRIAAPGLVGRRSEQRAIEAAFRITECTAGTHMQRILPKLGLRGQAQFAASVGGGASRQRERALR